MRLILVRHYRTVNNQARLIMGWGDAPPSEHWEDDLLEVAGRLEAREIYLDAVGSSELGRARRTARYYACRFGSPLIPGASQLNEVNYGDLYQRPKHWVEERVPQYKTDPDFVFPAGESFRQMQRRSVDFVLSLQHRHAGDTLMLVVHAGVIRGLVCHFLGLDLGANLKRKVSHRYVGDCVLEGDRCRSYDELGKPSGFVRDQVIRVPWVPAERSGAATVAEEPRGVVARAVSSESPPRASVLAV